MRQQLTGGPLKLQLTGGEHKEAAVAHVGRRRIMRKQLAANPFKRRHT
jgi:hypothetical protein